MSRDREYTSEDFIKKYPRSISAWEAQRVLVETLSTGDEKLYIAPDVAEYAYWFNEKTNLLLDEAIDIIKDHHDKLWGVELDDRVAMFLQKLEQSK